MSITVRRRTSRSAMAIALALAMLAAPPPAAALPPLLAMMGKQALTSMFRDALLGSLRDSGCKGAALANAIGALDLRGGGGAGALAGMAGMTGMTGMPGGGAIDPAMLGRLMGGAGALPPGVQLDPQQAAMLAQMQQMMAQPPLSPAETVATLDELAEIGLLPKPMQAEMKECMALMPQSTQAMGMAMGMLRPAIGQMRQAREQMAALSPDEQQQLAAQIADELRDAPADERKQMLDALGRGFLPPAVVEGVRAKLGAR